MRTIDLDSWPRRHHFETFRGLDYPHFGLCADVVLTDFYPYVKEHGLSFNLAMIYVISRAANSIPEFRQRIRGETVWNMI